MKTCVILLILVLALGGCIARNVSLSGDEAALARFQDVLVVAMEPPPLMVPPRFESAILGTLPKYPIQAARAGGVLASVAILAEMPFAARRSTEASRRLEELLSQDGPWEPTKILAQEAASRLAAAGQRRVILRPQMQPIPGLGDRHFNPLTRNWLGPIRSWYNQAEAPGRFQGEALGKMDAVVEIAILNYEINPDNQLSLQVLVKMVDPATGQVIGRAQASDHFGIGAPEQACAKGGQHFKEIFGPKGKELMAKCLKEIGVI
jgi:hypothetical protein